MLITRSSILVCYLCYVVMVRSSENTTTDIPPPCLTEFKIKDMFSYFHMNGLPLKCVGNIITILEDSATNCSLNTTSIVEEMTLPALPRVDTVALICRKRTHIHMTDYKGDHQGHIILDIQVVNCTFDILNFNHLLNVGDAKVLIATSKITRSNELDSLKDLDQEGLENIAAFVYIHLYRDKPQIADIFDVNKTYPLLAEIELNNMSLQVLPNNINEILPNLQSLELSRNKLTLPPEKFPWIDTTVRLPKNMSRSPFMQSHYSSSEFIEIPDNIFRRYFTLDDNQIENLDNFSFHGFLHKISLQRNGLKVLGNVTFENANGLQNLDLSENDLQVLPSKVFAGLTDLKFLSLKSNKLQNLPAMLFYDLHSLKFLDLSNNSITSLPVGLFTNLDKLEQLRLEHNQIQIVEQNAFPLSSIHLKKLHFQFNPIKELPEFPFWIRSLTLADFHNTHITFNNFTEFLESMDSSKVLYSVVDSASNSDLKDLLKRSDVLKKIDLSNSRIKSLELDVSQSKELERLLLIILLHFEFDLKGNPLVCDCNINSLSQFIDTNVINGTIPEDEYFFNDWICDAPIELSGKRLLKIVSQDTYCSTNISGCPSICSCYERSTVDRIIVDCRNKGLFNVHSALPEGLLELWYRGNNLTEIHDLDNAENIHTLDVSFNNIVYIDLKMFTKMSSLKDLQVQANALAYLPNTLMQIRFTSVTIWPNPFTCDCNTLWMKKWLRNNENIIAESNKVTCKIEKEDGMRFTEVSNEKFVCHENAVFDETRYVVLPSVVCSTIIVLVLIISILVYAYRLECKVLLFVYFGVHPFDKDCSKLNEDIDCVIVHAGIETEWVMDRIVTLLENENYRYVVCDMARDFVIGYSFQENLTRTVRHSKRMIFCLSNDWRTTSDKLLIAWRIAQEKIKETKSHYGIIVSHEMNINEINEKDLKQFVKRGRFVDSNDKFFKDKIVYYMPQLDNNNTSDNNVQIVRFRRKSEYVSKCFLDSYCEEMVTDQEDGAQADNKLNVNTHVFITYHDDDFDYVLKELLPIIEQNGFSYCIADRDFVPGASKEENILNAINRCHRTLFVLSQSHVENEWSLFTFRAAYEKSLREKSNHLLVLIKEDVERNKLDEEVSHYLQNYICLNLNDNWFEKKLFNGLPLLKDREDLHTSPLFIGDKNIETEDIKVD